MKSKITRTIKRFSLGFFMGATMSVPGVSGGTMAVALGCYEKILSATANLRKKENFFYLLTVGIGGIAGFLLMAGILNVAFQILPLTMTMLFCGAVGTGIYLLGKEAIKEGFSVNGILFFLLGLGCVLAVENLPQGGFAVSPLLSVLWGIFLAAGIILPGISTSHLLVIFGLYDDITHISSLSDAVVLLPLVLGAVAGIFLLTKPLSKALEKYPAYCKFALTGFATGSLKALISPLFGNPQTDYLLWFQVMNGIILAAGAAWGILRLTKKEEKMKKL